MLKRIVPVVISGKVQSFCLWGYTLAGIIFEFSAGLALQADALLGAQNSLFIQIRSVGAVSAGAFYLFTKEHSNRPLRIVFLIIHQQQQDFHFFFWLFEEI